jgi:pimeloyl-ACP methyl ester carboxylesterase
MQTRVVETHCGPVEYTDVGSGDPIIYFHGTGVTGGVMVAVESALAKDGFRLIVPNRPGYGRTPLPGRSSARDCANLAAALLDMLDLPCVAVMGSSGGATFAAAFALNFPSRTHSLVLLCPQVHRWDHKRWLPATSRWTLPLLRRPWLRRLLLRMYRILVRRMSATRLLQAEAGSRYPEAVRDPQALALCEATLAAMRQGTLHPGFENDLEVFIKEDVVGSDTRIETPTLVLHDEADPSAPVAHVNWLASRCTQCERVSLHAAGHLVWVGPDADAMHRKRVQFLRSTRVRNH